MPVSIEDVEKVADLAKLVFSDAEKESLAIQLNKILDYVEKLNELDTENVKPTSHVLTIKNVFRPDEIKPSLPREKLLANASAQEKGFFKVPKVIE